MSEQVGISGLAIYVPPYRVDLEDWCEWTGSPWEENERGRWSQFPHARAGSKRLHHGRYRGHALDRPV